MRPLLASLVALIVLGCVGAYSVFVRTLPPLSSEASELRSAPGRFSVDITLTFNAEADSFSLKPTSLLLQVEDHVTRIEEPIFAGQPLQLEIPQLRVGANDLYLEVHAGDAAITRDAAPPAGFSLNSEPAPAQRQQSLLPARAVRVRVLRDGVPIHQQTLWSEPGQPVAGSITLDVPAGPASEAHDH